MDSDCTARQLKSTGFTPAIELVMVISLGILVFIVSSRHDVMEHFVEFSKRYEEWNLDEMLVLSFYFTIVMFIFAMRRWREIRHSQEALRNNEERFRHAMEATNDVLWEWDISTGRTYFSPAYFRMFGYDPESFAGSFHDRLDLIHPDDRAHALQIIRDCIENRREAFQVEFRMRAHDGDWRWILGRGMAVKRDADGNALLLVGTHVDNTERKRAEEERLEFERKLQHIQKLESLGVLAGGIAHDFNNLLAIILGNLELAMMSLPAESPLREICVQAIEACNRAVDLVKQMLAYSGKGLYVLAETSLNDIINETLALIQASVNRNVHLDVSLDPMLPTTRADVSQIQQVIMNLVTNASEAIGDGPGKISLSTGVKECDDNCLSLSRVDENPPPGRFAYVEVSDTGCGMDEGTRQRLFEPFFTTKFFGRGLGMSAVLGIVRTHRGAILLDSSPGTGTSICVLLPTSETESSRSHPDAAPVGQGEVS